MIIRSAVRETPLALVIDDDQSMQLAMRAALTKAGFNVQTVSSGNEGITFFTEERPDLIFLDVIMPEMDGFETCSLIRNLPGGKYVQIIMVTGLDDTESTEKAFKVGANGFIAKPINWVTLGHRGKYMLRAGRAFQELEKSKSRLSRTQKIAKLGNWEVDLLTGQFHCSSEARSLLGIYKDESEFTFSDFFSSIAAEEHEHVKQKIENAINSLTSFNVNYRVIHPDGTICHILNQGEILYNDENQAELMLGAVQDVTQLKLAEEEIRLLAFYDSLTGLANRMLFLNRLDQEIANAKRKGIKFALLYLDLDQFKRVNDTFGHHIGDLLLRKVSNVLQRCIRSTDIASRVSNSGGDTVIARLGGDEFTIIISDIKEPENAAAVARRIITEIPKPLLLEGNEIAITTSIGISLYPADGEDGTTLLKNADTAMYKAKNSGRNNYQFYKKSLNIATLERFSLERDLVRALEEDQFLLYYQPKINTKNRKVVGGEALIRWFHPDKGMIPPGKFIPIAEESGHIVSINHWVLRQACRQWGEWYNQGYDPGIIAVNLSGYQFAPQHVITTIKEMINQVNLPPRFLELEITENVLMQNTKETNYIINQLKTLGVRIALDDFGTGYSSLSYLTSFEADTIKIDRSFVMNSSTQPNNVVIIKTIIAMGHSLGMTVVAEGVETEEQYRMVKNFGADQAQGFYFSPPIPHDEYARLISTENVCL